MTPKKARARWEGAFLTKLRNSANVWASCEAAGVSRQAAYKRRDVNATFRADWDSALDEACDMLEGVARERAMATSDTLLIFLLKAHRPALYRDRLRLEVDDDAVRAEARRFAQKMGMSEEQAVRHAEAIIRGED